MPPTAAQAARNARPAPQTGDGDKDKKKGLAALVGPGLLTGASDDDPSGIGTYAQVGAQFGFGLLWTMLFSYPLMVAAQLVCARIGRVTGHGLAGNLREHMPRWALWPLVTLLLAANTINIGADLAAMGEAAELVTGRGPHVFTIG
ncbi:MAG: divalent metal cation transporter, partial [Burkholderiaceae bacterium]